jgi:hypothetical protein
MRYLLMFVGLAGLAIGGWMSFEDRLGGDRLGGMLFLLGTVWGAAGFATEDIVSAIRRKPRA